MSIVNQREVGLDTHAFHNALKNAMREAPDVILIGEILDAETMEAAIAFAETGHLCLAPCTPTTPTRPSSASSTSSRKARTRTC
jgi:Tfp pilus assembly ATPase PilU